MAARNIVQTFESNVAAVQYAMFNFSTSKSPALKSELQGLDNLVTTSLTPRVRAVTVAAEELTNELATTSTLAVKQLNNALDKGIRKRNRRFRWVRRFAYVLLEWVLVGVMWWLWMIVMIWKIFRGIWRGTVTGIRWILWL
jgi:hypothetical protein